MGAGQLINAATGVGLPRHPGLDPGSMNTAAAAFERPCSWIPAFAGMTGLAE